MRRLLARPWAITMMAALILPLLSMGSSRADDFTPGRDSFYVSDQILNTVSKFKVSNGAFEGVIITGTTGGIDGPNGIVVNPVSPPEFVIANQNANQSFPGDIRVFEATGALKSVLVPHTDANAPFAPFAILLYKGELLVADEAGRVEAFNATTTPATFLQNFVITGYASADNFHPFGMVVGPDGKLYVASRSGDVGDVIRFDLGTKKFLDVFVSGARCRCNLDHPSGVVFGPDGRFYVTSSKPATAPTDDTDKILIFNGDTGAFVEKIDLDTPGALVRSAAPGLLFGPRGLLYVTIAQLDASGTATGVGSVRRYQVASKMFHDIVSPNTNLKLPSLFTFGGTNPATLVYEK